MEGRQMVQWDKDSCADAGFLKIDLLGLGMLSAVERCVDEVARSRGKRIDLSRISLDDEEVWGAIQRAETTGVFQIESRARIEMLPRTLPRDLDDITVQVALVRPGPIQGGAVHPYIQRRKRLREDPTYEVPYEHPSLEPVLRDTLGAIVFQDQVLEVAMALAGFSVGEAEGLRRAMRSKRSEAAILRYRRRFIEGAMDRGVSREVAERVYGQIEGFSGFGFPKAHSAAFGLLAYQSTWLRVHYGPELLCALLNEQPMRASIRPTRWSTRHSGAVWRFCPQTSTRASWSAGSRPPGRRPGPPAGRRSESGWAMSPRSPRWTPRPCSASGAAAAPTGASATSPAGRGHRGRRCCAWPGRGHATAWPPRQPASRSHRVRKSPTEPTSWPCTPRARRRSPTCWPRPCRWPMEAGGDRRCGSRGAASRATRTADGTQLALPLEGVPVPPLPPLGPWEKAVADYRMTGMTLGEHPMELMRPQLEGALTSADLSRAGDGDPGAGGRHGRGSPAPGDGERRRLHAARGRTPGPST